MMVSDNRNHKQSQKEQSDNKQVGKSGRQSQGNAPRTTETGGQNNGGQTERARDNAGNKKRGAGK